MAKHLGWFIRARRMFGKWCVSYSGSYKLPTTLREWTISPLNFYSRERAEAVRDALSRTADAEHEAWERYRR